jgi:hypothetical protein
MSYMHSRPASPATVTADLYEVVSRISLHRTDPPANDRNTPRSAPSEYPMTYETAYRALGSAKDIKAVNHILAIVAAMEAKARASNDRSLELDAIELRFHAECRLDDMVADHTS